MGNPSGTEHRGDHIDVMLRRRASRAPASSFEVAQSGFKNDGMEVNWVGARMALKAWDVRRVEGRDEFGR